MAKRRRSLDDETTVHAKVLLITAGIGKFTARPLPAGEGWTERGLVFFVRSDKRLMSAVVSSAARPEVGSSRKRMTGSVTSSSAMLTRFR